MFPAQHSSRPRKPATEERTREFRNNQTAGTGAKKGQVTFSKMRRPGGRGRKEETDGPHSLPTTGRCRSRTAYHAVRDPDGNDVNRMHKKGEG